MKHTRPSAVTSAYDEWHRQLCDETGGDAPWHRLALKYIDPARDISGRDVLEIGCGRGGFGARLLQTVPHPRSFVGADFSSVAIEAAERSFPSRSGGALRRWEIQDILALTYSDEVFDTVISCETIEHVPEPQKAIEELGRVLRPGGKLVLTTPNYFGLMGWCPSPGLPRC